MFVCVHMWACVCVTPHMVEREGRDHLRWVTGCEGICSFLQLPSRPVQSRGWGCQLPSWAMQAVGTHLLRPDLRPGLNCVSTFHARLWEPIRT